MSDWRKLLGLHLVFVLWGHGFESRSRHMFVQSGTLASSVIQASWEDKLKTRWRVTLFCPKPTLAIKLTKVVTYLCHCRLENDLSQIIDQTRLKNSSVLAAGQCSTMLSNAKLTNIVLSNAQQYSMIPINATKYSKNLRKLNIQGETAEAVDKKKYSL